MLNEQTDDTSTDIALCIFCGKQTFKKDRKLHKIKIAERLQNVKDAAEGQNDYKMSGLLSNATFIDKAVYHSVCITMYMLYHRSCYKTYTSRRNCGFFKVESAGSDHKRDTSEVPLLNEQADDTSTDIALCIFCGKQTF